MTTLDDALVAVIEKAVSSIEHATTFVMSELPEVIHQLLIWHAVKHGIHAVVGVALIFMAVYLNKRAMQQLKNRHANATSYIDKNAEWVAYIVGASITAVAVFAFAMHLINLTWLQIILAPKLYLIEYAASLISK